MPYISGLGNDLVRIQRFRAFLTAGKKGVLDRLFTREEQDFCLSKRDPAPHLAVRFAAKEAIIKALGGVNGGAFREIEVLSDPLGKPVVRLHGEIQKRADSLDLSGFAISLSHCREYAVAFAVAQER